MSKRQKEAIAGDVARGNDEQALRRAHSQVVARELAILRDNHAASVPAACAIWRLVERSPSGSTVCPLRRALLVRAPSEPAKISSRSKSGNRRALHRPATPPEQRSDWASAEAGSHLIGRGVMAPRG